TPITTLERAIKIAKDVGVEYVYIGNVWGHRFENTFCPNCGETLIERRGFYIGKINLEDTKCPTCGYKQNIVL
ncbi:MAG: AmmeMemoRadiSam system radical SAM enzyme, partial [Archaeoglobaceae archaeon]